VGIVTSANLTNGGLRNNSETGLLITDERALVDIRNRIQRNIDYVHLTEQQIGLFCAAVDSVRIITQRRLILILAFLIVWLRDLIG
jgi:phosphatidylserine/phosphatidylglycerophosphate/cardiolipin synthase-like enzyme